MKGVYGMNRGTVDSDPQVACLGPGDGEPRRLADQREPADRTTIDRPTSTETLRHVRALFAPGRDGRIDGRSAFLRRPDEEDCPTRRMRDASDRAHRDEHRRDLRPVVDEALADEQVAVAPRPAEASPLVFVALRDRAFSVQV